MCRRGARPPPPPITSFPHRQLLSQKPSSSACPSTSPSTPGFSEGPVAPPVLAALTYWKEVRSGPLARSFLSHRCCFIFFSCLLLFFFLKLIFFRARAQRRRQRAPGGSGNAGRLSRRRWQVMGTEAAVQAGFGKGWLRQSQGSAASLGGKPPGSTARSPRGLRAPLRVLG